MEHWWIMGTPQRLLPWFIWPDDSRLKFHLRLLPSSAPSCLSSSSRMSSSLRIWAVPLRAISSTETWTPASLAAQIRKLSSLQLQGRYWVDSIIVKIKDDLDGWIWFQCDSCLGRNLHDDDLSVGLKHMCSHTVWMNLRILSKSHPGCTKLRLSIRTWHAPEHREPGDPALDWLTLSELTQQVMKHQSIIEIFLQTLNHYVLGFQSAIDPLHQRLQKKGS